MNVRRALTLLFMITIATHAVSQVLDPDIECAAYWQLKSVGLAQEYSIAAAIESEKYQQQYVAAKNTLTTHHGSADFTRQFYDSVKVMLASVDNDLSNTVVLDEQYQERCTLETEAQ
ncbi:hypothetical protein QWY82_05570 [Simiduia curdlanivorans]|uniref:Uncharacterized protein n=1 Tax=Simiduia curdlanivorans TaxID=1492769 RepID=A0ABV8V5K8_9GAMM|nr:hypothetical protein [Simiduia curdlanivorans]MDN3638280.1 hypothetical protein [Simiduia curdlanivorans]